LLRPFRLAPALQRRRYLGDGPMTHLGPDRQGRNGPAFLAHSLGDGSDVFIGYVICVRGHRRLNIQFSQAKKSFLVYLYRTAIFPNRPCFNRAIAHVCNSHADLRD
jgi:hypothetical protein